MKNAFLKLYIKIRMLRDDRGQDLVEYALVIALIALAATVGMTGLANQISAAFTSVGTKLGAYTS